MTDEKHQAALDGIRGFAALSVVLFHIGHWLNVPLASNSFLAVDLFFLLSGYVITLAYDHRLKSSMTVGHFIALRLVRLMPLVILGTVVSAAYVTVRVYVKHENLAAPDLATAILLGTTNIPYLTAPLVIGGNQIFPLNGPQFSLFLEVFINIFWAVIGFVRLRSAAFAVAIGCFAMLLVVGQLGGDSADTFLIGLPRVGASFFAGVVIFHLDRSLPSWRWWPPIFWACCLIMLATFYAPELPAAYQIAWIATVSPLLVLSGARTILHGRVRHLALLGGRLSYPIYILHYPVFVWVNGIYQTLFKRQDPFAEGIILLVAVIAISFIALPIYDEPIRRKFNAWMRQNRGVLKLNSPA